MNVRYLIPVLIAGLLIGLLLPACRELAEVEGMPTATSAGATPVPAADSMAQMASEVIALVNEERVDAGCPELVPNEQLTRAAQAHSQDMAENSFLDHTGSDGSNPADRVQEAGYRFRIVAENVAAGPPNAQIAVDGWMASPGHRENILNCDLQETGVSVVENPEDPAGYGLYWTQKFGTPLFMLLPFRF